ncbi:MAG: hypothetical protein JWL89_693 [Candidatus Saccharibacteria bacterium]|nr:hypothetical protein [Candidatus Saccharibacteria bacterium]
MLGFAFCMFLFSLLFAHGAAPGLAAYHKQLTADKASARKNSSPKTTASQAKKTNPLTASVNQITPVTPRSIAQAHVGMAQSSSLVLRKLAEYEKVYGGALASHAMLFTNIPTTQSDVPAAAADMAGTLQEFAHYGVQPLVVMEPTNERGVVDFRSYSQGAYDSILDAYYQSLQQRGVTSASMGTWAYFPEANHPEWGPTNPADFAPNITRTVNLQKKYFPGSQASILLDSQSYPAGSTDWGGGSYVSLLPYVKDIPVGLIDSFGYQGFPWAPAAGVNQASSYNPAQYLASSLASEAARQLGAHSIWLNTGTFGRMYAQNASQQVSVSPLQRQAMLTGVVQQARNLQTSGFNISVNLFSEDKSATSEGTDWSYWKAGAPVPSDNTMVFIDFVNKLVDNHIDFWLFDSF